MRWYYMPELLPPVYAGIDSMRATAETEDTELRQFYAVRDTILANFFVQTCDVKTLQYWEQLLGIELDGGETIAQRRQMILMYLVANWQITKPYVEKVGIGYFGEGNFSVTYDPDNHLIVDIRMWNSDYNFVRRFVKWFERVCPAHIKWDAVPVFPSESIIASISRGMAANIAKCEASMVSGSETLYLGQTPQVVETLEV